VIARAFGCLLVIVFALAIWYLIYAVVHLTTRWI
jgi:hypothetical protein